MLEGREKLSAVVIRLVENGFKGRARMPARERRRESQCRAFAKHMRHNMSGGGMGASRLCTTTKAVLVLFCRLSTTRSAEILLPGSLKARDEFLERFLRTIRRNASKSDFKRKPWTDEYTQVILDKTYIDYEDGLDTFPKPTAALLRLHRFRNWTTDDGKWPYLQEWERIDKSRPQFSLPIARILRRHVCAIIFNPCTEGMESLKGYLVRSFESEFMRWEMFTFFDGYDQCRRTTERRRLSPDQREEMLWRHGTRRAWMEHYRRGLPRLEYTSFVRGLIHETEHEWWTSRNWSQFEEKHRARAGKSEMVYNPYDMPVIAEIAGFRVDKINVWNFNHKVKKVAHQHQSDASSLTELIEMAEEVD